MATFLVQNDLLLMRDTLADSVAATKARVLEQAPRLDFPVSVVSYFQGHLGRPPGGFPRDLQQAVLKGLPVVEGRRGESLAPLDLDALAARLAARTGQPVPPGLAISHALYPRVLDEYMAFVARHADVSILDTPTFFYGLEVDQEISVDLEPGKTLVIKLCAIGEAGDDGNRTVFFELNGQGRQVEVRDRSLATAAAARRVAERGDPGQIGAPMPGTVIGVHCKVGDAVEEGDPLLTLEAMKMETVLRAPAKGKVEELVAKVATKVLAQDLLVVLSA
jgi:pyruvate carboxylase